MTRMTRVLRHHERGVTGLETAIILIAFIVVASVFAYTILSAGLFSAQKTEEVARGGIEEAESTIVVSSNVVAYKGTANGDECVTKVSFTVSKAVDGGDAVDLTPSYRVDANGALASSSVSDCDTVWTAASSNVSVATDSSDYKESPRSNKLTIAGAFTTGNIAYYPLSSAKDVAYASQITCWVKSSVAQSAGTLQLKLFGTATPSTAIETLSFPAIPSNTWTEAIMSFANPGTSSLESVRSVALSAASDPGAVTLHIDDVKIRTRTGGAKNVTMIAYNDANNYIDNVAWTVDFAGGYGSGTDDFMLENSEKATVTVWLQDYDGSTYSNGTDTDDPFIDSNTAHLKTSSEFTLQIMPPEGATLFIQKRTPAYLDNIMRIF